MASRHYTAAKRDKDRLMDAAKGLALDDYWLKEAAALYYIDLCPRKDGRHIYTRLNDLVSEVLQCVAQDKLSGNAGVAGNDARRRRLLLNSLHTGSVVQNIKKMAAEVGVPIQGCSRASWKQAEKSILIRACPEAERLALVREFWVSRGRIQHKVVLVVLMEAYQDHSKAF